MSNQKETRRLKAPKIELLSAELLDQIAAGEVVERPASVLKELLENSLDAGADELEASVENGGQTLITVRDNGCGISAEDLALAVTSHATSKIHSFQELLRVSSYGFRGEALPSVASVSRLEIRSMTRRDDGALSEREKEHGSFIRVSYGRMMENGPAVMTPGTYVEVRDLFSNVPARLKFLKSNATELKRCQDVFLRMALGHCGVSFSMLSGGRELHRFIAGESLAGRLEQIWPPRITSALVPFDWERSGIRVRGLAGLPDAAQPRADRMLFYVNGRPVQDRLLQRAAREAYKGRLLSREYPQLVLFLEIEPEEVDVNAHPAKSEVRFRDERVVFGAVLRGVERALSGHSVLDAPGLEDLFPALAGRGADLPGLENEPPDRENAGTNQGARPGNADRPPGFWGSLDDSPRPRKSTWAGDGVPPKFKSDAGMAAPVSPAPVTPLVRESASVTYAPERPERPRPFMADCAGEEEAALSRDMRYLGQLADTYLLLRQNERLLILDQHAAHEIILMHRFTSGAGHCQYLALPLELSLHPAESSRLDLIWGELLKLGFSLQREGGGPLHVRGIPHLLDRGQALELLRDVLAEKATTRKEKGNPLRDLLVMMSCKGAIKAGQKLSTDEALGLLKQWLDLPGGAAAREFCPHGRPAALSLDGQELERMFKRRG